MDDGWMGGWMGGVPPVSPPEEADLGLAFYVARGRAAGRGGNEGQQVAAPLSHALPWAAVPTTAGGVLESLVATVNRVRSLQTGNNRGGPRPRPSPPHKAPASKTMLPYGRLDPETEHEGSARTRQL